MTTRYFRIAIVLTVALMCGAPLNASDWPHWLGPNGNNIAPDADGVNGAEGFEPDLNKWNVAWSGNVGLGYSSLAVAHDRAFTMGHDGKGQETIWCLNAATGATIWKHSYDAKLIAHLHTGGPNATPTIAGANVITLSKDGQIFCLSTDKGAIVWQANLLDIFKIKLPEWGFASSAVIDGNQVLFCGGKTCALDPATGKTLWVSQTAYVPAGYAASPAFELDGKKFVAALDGKGFSVLSANDGAEVARHPFKALFNMNATTPMILEQGKRIFISNTISSDMLAFDGQKLTRLWTSKDMKNLMNNSVFKAGAIYGMDGEQQQPSNSLVCLDEASGKENWSKQEIGYGITMAVGNTLLILTELGELISVKLDPAKYVEISRRKVLDKVCWTTPTYANGRIYLRNDQGKVLCLGGK